MIHPSLIADDIEIKDSDIEVNVYGKEGEGIITLNLKEDYLTQGYYIEYVIIKQGEEFLPDLEWTKGDYITGLSDTDTLYARITDGTKYADGIFTINLTDLL